MLLFANYKTIVEKIRQRPECKEQGQRRAPRLYTAHHACWDAKNRFGLPGGGALRLRQYCRPHRGQHPAPAAPAAPTPRRKPAPAAATWTAGGGVMVEDESPLPRSSDRLRTAAREKPEKELDRRAGARPAARALMLADVIDSAMLPPRRAPARLLPGGHAHRQLRPAVHHGKPFVAAWDKWRISSVTIPTYRFN